MLVLHFMLVDIVIWLLLRCDGWIVVCIGIGIAGWGCECACLWLGLLWVFVEVLFVLLHVLGVGFIYDYF
jgi:hypothetical protein